MDYRANLKQLLMRGQMFKLKGQGISGVGIPQMQIKDYRGTGTISHRAAVDRAINSMNNLNISGQGARKKNYGISGQGKSKAKKSKGSENFKSLKFNF
jgi:hypothetical protein